MRRNQSPVKKPESKKADSYLYSVLALICHPEITSAADRLRNINQFLDPFKFVVYAEVIGKEHKPIPGMDSSSVARL